MADGGRSRVGLAVSSKCVIVTMAYEECGLAGYEFDVTHEELKTGLRRLDTMMAEWQPSLPLGYNGGAGIGQGNLDDPSGIPDYAVDVAAKYLALRIAPTMGKALDGPARYALTVGMRNLYAQASFVPAMALPRGTVRGSGNRRLSRSPFIIDDSAAATQPIGTLGLGS